jgi:putative DNA primase/helicase
VPVLESALSLWRAGLSVVPVRRDGSKAPALASWKEYQARRPTEAECRAWWDRPDPPGVGVVCGAVSGGLVVLDFETRAAFDKWARLVNEKVPGCLDGLPMVETPGGGRHVYYRTGGAVPAGSKLAYRRDLETGDLELVAETRGEGHYVVAAGSPADVHPAGVEYKLIRKGWLDAG